MARLTNGVKVPGTRLLRKILKTYGGALTELEVAQAIGVAQQTVSAYAKRGVRPTQPHVRQALERVYGIPQSSWQTPEERKLATGRRSMPPSAA